MEYECAHTHSHICSRRVYRRVTRLTLSVLALGLQRVVCVKYQRWCESEQSCVRDTEKRSPFSSVCAGCCICRWLSSVNSQPLSKGDSCLPSHQHRWLRSQIPIVHVSTQRMKGSIWPLSATLRRAGSLVCMWEKSHLDQVHSLAQVWSLWAIGPLRIYFSSEG